ncbi:group 3 secretory phospholipase A2-like [Thalassophryne amazonica]|uniref:group 3 secretory phospholipase A2-like n=1 Tax=Thalassophryne amazonica TaxID=390379 RepID=UPI001470C2E5|nr:group 3 secretory phospholipase A2-like [Thalassophryne amazonica]
MTHAALGVLVIFTSSLPLWTTAGASILCPWTKVLSNEETHYSFVRSDPSASPSARLYHSVWSAQRALLGCTWSDDTGLIQDYVSACRERTHDVTEHRNGNFDLESMFAPKEPCVSLNSLWCAWQEKRTPRTVRSASKDSQVQGERSEVKRAKRFIVPGTLWCGDGHKAPSYSDLGFFSETDICCREHDLCEHNIPSFHSDFGLFNTNLFTISHCDCDKKFRSCLMAAEGRLPDAVGYTFFNLLKVNCFEFTYQLQCSERNWFGMCQEMKMGLVAVAQSPSPYQPSVWSNVSALNTSQPRQVSVPVAAPTAAPPSVTSPSASNDMSTTHTNTSQKEGNAGAFEGSIEPAETSDIQRLNQTMLTSDSDITYQQMQCSVYKDLDECRNRILPRQSRYDLHNPEPRTLYHCSCTARLFQSLAKQGQLSEEQLVLLEHVSSSCFLLQGCAENKSCTAFTVRVQLPALDQRDADKEQQRPLQAVKPKRRRTKRKHRPVRLHKLCLRLVLSNLHNTRKST